MSNLSETTSNFRFEVGRQKCVTLLAQSNRANASVLLGTSRSAMRRQRAVNAADHCARIFSSCLYKFFK